MRRIVMRLILICAIVCGGTRENSADRRKIPRRHEFNSPAGSATIFGLAGTSGLDRAGAAGAGHFVRVCPWLTISISTATRPRTADAGTSNASSRAIRRDGGGPG